jgi:hypothetical protein
VLFNLIKNKMKKEKPITIKTVLHWIVDNQNETDLMDMVNRTSFPFTSHFKKHYEKKDFKIKNKKYNQ